MAMSFHKNRFGCLLLLMVALANCAAGLDLTVLFLDGKTGRPLQRKDVCVSFNSDPRGNGTDKPGVCGRTNAKGVFKVPLGNPVPPIVHVAVLTNNLLPCFKTPNAFLIADVIAHGGWAENTCNTVKHGPDPAPGELVIFAHQMTFLEVLKRMGKEL
jgi:hypothetical protein